MRLRRGCAAVTAALALGGCTATTSGHGAPDSQQTRPSASSAAATSQLLRGPYTAARPGQLPAAGAPIVSGVHLPPGRPRFAYNDAGKQIGTAPVIWVTDQVQHPAGDLVARLQQLFAQTGLWPVVLQADQTSPDDGRPWVTKELGAPEPVPSQDVTKNFTELWHEFYGGTATDDLTRSFGRNFPGLATTSGDSPESIISSSTAGLPGRIGLIPTTNPADVPALIGWYGATNYYGPGEVSFVLRSWQARFGAELIRMGFDYIEVAVRKPARTMKEALSVVAEQFAVCPDQVVQGDYDTVGAYARSLIGATTWYCWWD